MKKKKEVKIDTEIMELFKKVCSLLNRKKINMCKYKLCDILKNLDEIMSLYIHERSHFPYIKASVIGGKIYSTAPFYMINGEKLRFNFPNGLTAQLRDKINETGHWINQNFIVRLCASLDYYGFYEKIDKSINGWEAIDILRRLRQRFAHKTGQYNPTSKDDRKLLSKMNDHLNLNLDISRLQDFPLSIDTVIEPLFKKCKEYVVEKYNKECA
ncbi:MAG: hypothetical protein ABIJ45_09215 [Candidatus Zixiibacteriota bacterium]